MLSMEELKKKFILLSQVAKEKKYAQEYLGLLARRGEIGSIRIGKRWYTSWQWFEEFLENSQKKKRESVLEKRIREPEKIAIVQPAAKAEETKKFFENSARISVSAEEKKLVQEIEEIRERKEAQAVKIKPRSVRIANGISVSGTRIPAFAKPRMRAQFNPPAPLRAGNISAGERNWRAIPYKEIKIRKKTGIFSPDFFAIGEKKMAAVLFPRFALALSFSVIIFLIALSGYFIWSGGLLAKGQVAGESDEKKVGISGIQSKSEHFFTTTGDKMKEAVSISRIVVQATKEKENQEN